VFHKREVTSILLEDDEDNLPRQSNDLQLQKHNNGNWSTRSNSKRSKKSTRGATGARGARGAGSRGTLLLRKR
jgi:hypothetical protein